MISCFIVTPKLEFIGEHYVHLASSLALADIELRRAYFLETPEPISAADADRLAGWLADRVLETAEHGDRAVAATSNGDARGHVWIAYKRSVVDNESDSVVRICALLGIPATAAKVATGYFSTDAALEQRITERLFNPNTEELSSHLPAFDTLRPVGEYLPAETVDLRGAGDERLAAVGRANGRNLNLRQMRQIAEIQHANGWPAVADALLEALDARWSDHCYHVTWKALGGLLKRLAAASQATANPNILSMFVDNAGVWDFYDGHALVIKGETHNGPSAISAYFGQLTKLGGVLRDIIGAGLAADPVGSFEYTATGIPSAGAAIPGLPAPREIVHDTIRAIKEYGNTFGVPMMWSRMEFHPAYRAKPFALGGAIGLIPSAYAQKGRPAAGDFVVLIGGLTGNDGIHGASASSAGATMDQAAVQIGSPLEEVKFRGAIIELRDSGCLRAITDVGGAGLNSAVGEMGDPCGVWLNCALVPLKTSGLPMWRILLSESQERMVLAVIPDRFDDARRILTRHAVRTTVIGKFTGSGRYVVVYDPKANEETILSAPPDDMPMTGEVGFDVSYAQIEYEPEPIAPSPPVPTQRRTTTWPAVSAHELAALMPQLLGDIGVCDQSFAGSQYDSSVQGHRTYGPYEGERRPVHTGYWAAQVIPDRPYAAVFATAFAPRLSEAAPRLALRQCFCELIGKLVLAGVRRRDVALCDNFYTPHLSDGWAYWLVQMVDELAALTVRFGTPVISGKDSSAGSVRTPEGFVHVPPAAFLSGLGKVPSYDALLRGEWTRPGSLIVRIGPVCPSAAGTVGGRVIGIDANDVDEIDAGAYERYLDALENVDRSLLRSGVQLGSGGVLAALAQGATASGFGARLTGSLALSDLLGEHRCGALVEIEPSDLARLPAELDPQPVAALVEQGPSVTLDGVELLTPAAVRAWETAFEVSIT